MFYRVLNIGSLLLLAISVTKAGKPCAEDIGKETMAFFEQHDFVSHMKLICQIGKSLNATAIDENCESFLEVIPVNISSHLLF
jgi:hypothetical protein